MISFKRMVSLLRIFWSQETLLFNIYLLQQELLNI